MHVIAVSECLYFQLPGTRSYYVCAFETEEPSIIKFLFPLEAIRNCDQGTL